MANSVFRKSLLGFAATAVLAMGAAAPAQAAVYRGSWDPAYGVWFSELGWEGTSEYYVPDSCVVSDGLVTSSSCAGMTAGFASVGLYSLTGPAQAETLSFNQLVNVSQVQYVGGVLVGVKSDFFLPPVTATIAAAGGGDYSFALKFGLEGARLFHSSNDPFDTHPHQEGEGHDEHGNGLGLGHNETCAAIPSENDSSQYCGFSESYAKVDYVLVAIPEPETYALMLAGLAAVGFMSRRRRRT